MELVIKENVAAIIRSGRSVIWDVPLELIWYLGKHPPTKLDEFLGSSKRGGGHFRSKYFCILGVFFGKDCQIISKRGGGQPLFGSQKIHTNLQAQASLGFKVCILY